MSPHESNEVAVNLPESGLTPDELPPVWNIRAARFPSFTNREDELEEVRAHLASSGHVVINEESMPVGGIGKTELAREYAFRHADEYQVVWWIQGEEASILQIGYVQLMTALALLSGRKENVDHSPEDVMDFLSQHSGWLLIVDNLDNYARLKEFIPGGRSGHVIVTTLLGAASSPYPCVSLRPFDADASAEFLLQRVSSLSDAQAQELARAVGHSPLNLRLLTGLLKAAGISADEALQRLLARTPAPLRDDTSNEISRGLLRIVVGVILDHLKNEDPGARDLLSLFSFFGPADIPLTVLDKEPEGLSQRLSAIVEDEALLERTLDTLRQYELLEVHEDSISLRELVQEAVRESLTDEARKAWANAAVRLALRAFPAQPDYPHPMSICTRLVPHALACTQYAEESGIARENAAQLLYQTALYMHGRAALKDARTFYLLAIAAATKAFGNTHQSTATYINSLGTVEHALGNLLEAKQCFEKAFEIIEKLYGPAHEAVYAAPDDSIVAMPIRNLCTVLEEMGDIEAAQKAYEDAMDIFLAIYGWNHPLVAECADRFGRTWQRLKKLPKARNCFEKAVLSEESSPDPDDTKLAVYLNNLATVLMEMKEPRLALERVERALRLDKNRYGESHAVVGRDLANLANAYRQLRRYREAEETYKEAIAIIEKHEGENSRRLATLLNHLGVVFLENDKPSEARSTLERGLAIVEEEYGPDAPAIVRNLTNLGRALAALEAYNQAVFAYERALGILEQNSEGKSDRIATILYRIGRTLNAQGEHKQALGKLQRAMKIDAEVFGKEHPNVARDAFMIGCVLAELDDTVVAMGHLTLALDLYEMTQGKNSSNVQKVRQKLDELTL